MLNQLIHVVCECVFIGLRCHCHFFLRKRFIFEKKNNRKKMLKIFYVVCVHLCGVYIKVKMCFTIQRIIRTYPFCLCKRVALVYRKGRLSFHTMKHSIALMCLLYLRGDL